MAELLLYEADRAQHVKECLEPELKRGRLVLCDRYTDSTVAYQGDGRGLDRRAIETLNAIATQGLVPDLTILLDVPAARGLRQAYRKKKGHDRLEKAGLAFHKRVRRGFLRQAKRAPRRFRGHSAADRSRGHAGSHSPGRGSIFWEAQKEKDEFLFHHRTTARREPGAAMAPERLDASAAILRTGRGRQAQLGDRIGQGAAVPDTERKNRLRYLPESGGRPSSRCARGGSGLAGDGTR